MPLRCALALAGAAVVGLTTGWLAGWRPFIGFLSHSTSLSISLSLPLSLLVAHTECVTETNYQVLLLAVVVVVAAFAANPLLLRP